MSSLTINISKLSEGSHQYAFEIQPKEILLDDSFLGTLRIEASVDKSGRQLLLWTVVRVFGRFTCDRCLTEFEKEVRTEYKIVYVTEEVAPSEDGEEEMQYLGPDTNLLDLGEDVRQYLMLGIPQKLLCTEDCRGLCPHCGVNKNIVSCACDVDDSDPRWDALKKISLN